MKTILLSTLLFLTGCATSNMNTNVIYRINCGSDKALADEAGNVWAPDQGFSESKAVVREASLPIHNTAAPEIYRHERYGMGFYTLPVEPGLYTVRLHFAETFDCNYKAGQRFFDVSINGKPVVQNFDPYTAAGGFGLPVVIEYAGCPATDHIQIDFSKGGAIYGIEVINAAPDTEASIRQITPIAEASETFIGNALELAPDAKTLKILFIGNSMTFYWAIPESLQTMLETGVRDLRIEPTRSLHGGKWLKYHYEETDAVELIKDGNFDYVVLQPHSKQARENDPEMLEYAAKFAEIIRESGANPLFYARPAEFPADEAEQKAFHKNQLKVAEAIHAPLIPGAEVLRRCIAQRPDLRFHNADTVHMGMYGGYAIACTFYAAFTGGAEFPPPAILAQQVAIDSDIAALIQQTALETVQEVCDPLPVIEK